MAEKQVTRAMLTEKDIEVLNEIMIDLTLYRPIWKLLNRLFNRFSLEEYDTLRMDIRVLMLSNRIRYEAINISYLSSLAKSFELLIDDFTVDMLETYGKLYQALEDDGIKLQTMYEELSEAFEKDR